MKQRCANRALAGPPPVLSEPWVNKASKIVVRPLPRLGVREFADLVERKTGADPYKDEFSFTAVGAEARRADFLLSSNHRETLGCAYWGSCHCWFVGCMQS